MKKKTRVPNWKMYEEIIKSWELDETVTDKEVLEDITSAMNEAYMMGCCDGGMDSEKFNEGLEFCKGLGR